MLLFELGDTELEVKSSHSQTGDRHSFKSENGTEITVLIHKVDDFSEMMPFKASIGGIGIEFDNESVSGDPQRVTGTGNQHQILTTVYKIINTAITKYKPEMIVFGAHEASRQKLYDRFSKLLERLHGYKREKAGKYLPADFEQSMGNSIYYILRKK